MGCARPLPMGEHIIRAPNGAIVVVPRCRERHSGWWRCASSGQWRERLAPNAAAHVVDVGVDRTTGRVKILRYTTFQDVGLCVSPPQVEGQMRGGPRKALVGAYRNAILSMRQARCGMRLCWITEIPVP
jgi:hypothetical protein